MASAPKSSLLAKESPGAVERKDAELWLRNYAGQVDLSFDELLEAGKDWIDSENYMCDGGKWEGTYTPLEFWDHYAKYTGEDVPSEKRGNFFTCSC